MSKNPLSMQLSVFHKGGTGKKVLSFHVRQFINESYLVPAKLKFCVVSHPNLFKFSFSQNRLYILRKCKYGKRKYPEWNR